jgi:hypothetical protein
LHDLALGEAFRITVERGTWKITGASVRTMATWHPSAILRTRGIGKVKAVDELG